MNDLYKLTEGPNEGKVFSRKEHTRKMLKVSFEEPEGSGIFVKKTLEEVNEIFESLVSLGIFELIEEEQDGGA